MEAECEWQKRLRSQNFGLKEIEAARGNTVTTDEMFVTDIKTILKYRDLYIKIKKKAYFTDLKILKMIYQKIFINMNKFIINIFYYKL